MSVFKRTEGAKLLAKSAADAHMGVNGGFLLAVFIRNDGNARAAYLHAGGAAAALFVIHVQRGLSLNAFEQRAGTAAYDNGGAVRSELFLYDLFKILKICGVGHSYMLSRNTQTRAYVLKAYVRRGCVFQRQTRKGILLMARHTGDPVVKDDNGGTAAVVYDIHKARHAGMHECRVADDSYGTVLVAADLVKSVQG